MTAAQSGGLETLLRQLLRLRGEMLERETQLEPHLSGVPEENRASARNLIHYIALRSHDLRDLQTTLARHGLSSLGRAEPHALWNLDAVLKLLYALVPLSTPTLAGGEAAVTPEEGDALLDRRTNALLGAAPRERGVRIMVTAPSEAGAAYSFVRDLVVAGMDCMRINCAHDDLDVWAGMVAHVRRAEAEVGRSCRILMDLPGPRVRTGPLEPGPEVIRIQPERDELGRVLRPARVWLTPAEDPAKPPSDADAQLPLPGDLLARLTAGHRVRFRDTRSKKRVLEVTGIEGGSRWAALGKTAYVATGTGLRLEGPDPDADELEYQVGRLPPVEQRLRLEIGDVLVLTREQDPGRPARVAGTGQVMEPARIACTPSEALDRVQVGERIWFDEGRIGGVIRAVHDREVRVEITSAKPGGSRLRGGKGINLPDSALSFPPLTERDLECLPFIARNADLVGYSFVRRAEDIRELQRRLAELGGAECGIVLKIETVRAFDQLPWLLLAAMHSPLLGVMIARGDLAVESGFPRLAEVQEEILWLCEAAHVPVIWATQVLEQLAKTGRPSRAEVTDAAMAERAECVMLNKGRYVLDAVRALDSILQRMQSHQEKKRPAMRRLHVAQAFFEAAGRQ